MLTSLFTGSLALFSTIASVSALPEISIKGTKFYDSNGDQFFIKGIAYQLSPDDPLQDEAQCQRDIQLMKTLGANTIRVYHVTSGNHDGCMQAFDEAGIYLFLDLDTFTSQIEQTNPSWTTAQMANFTGVMDEFSKYSNTAGFFIGNEVCTTGEQSEAAVYVKAAVRDMKAYRKSKGYRDIPIGYSHADVTILRPNLQNYLACGGNPDENIDFFGLNAYEWCGVQTFNSSGYNRLTEEIMNYPIPAFLSEDGCITPEPRSFQDQETVFGPLMTPYWSGAIVYEWIQEENLYGLISYGGNTNDLALNSAAPVVRGGTPTPVTPDFNNLMQVWKTVSPQSTPAAQYSPSNPNPVCPSYTASTWEINGNVPLPSINQAYNSAMQFAITAGASSVASGSGTAGGDASYSTGSMTASAQTAKSTHKSNAAGRLAPFSLGSIVMGGAGGDGSGPVLGTMVALGCVMLGFTMWL